ncbi:MAG TPA: NAD(P)H-quinone oxidoreductase [Gemmatimonadales bacterium]|nr:NAD(P)H-quinone oxidoreductase [Gemmatimonadales bacterium]
MRAIHHTAAGGPEVLSLSDAPTPEPGPAQIRVRVQAAGLNRADILQRRGRYPAPPGWPADIPGLEYAGTVDKVGADVSRWRPGDRVMGLVGGGAHAEFVVVHEEEALPVPDDMGMVEAAAIPESFLTGWDALVTRGRLAAGERVLLHAVGSGLGTAMIQLARRIGATVLGTSRTPAKLQHARALGLDIGIDTSGGGFRDAVHEPVNVIIDVLGGPAFSDNLAILAPRGRLVMLGFLQGSQVDTSLDQVLRKRLEVIGSVMRTRLLPERVSLVREFEAEVLPMLTGGRADGRTGGIRPIVGATFPFSEIVRAHEAMEANEPFGKIVLTWS